MAGKLLSMPRQAPLYNGAVQASSRLYFYLTGTSTPADTYTTPALSVAHANPVVADSTGVFAPIYLNPANGQYRVTWKTSADVQLSQDDNVPSSDSEALNTFSIVGAAPYLLLTESDASANNKNYRLLASGEQLLFQIGNDALSSWTTFIAIDRTANNADIVNLLASAVQVNGSSVAYITSGSFTATLTGMTAGTTGTINYYLVGTLVTLYAPAAITGTSNTTAMTMTGLSALGIPATARHITSVVLNDGNEVLADSSISAGGVITFVKAVTEAGANSDDAMFTGSNFRNTGTKGLPQGWSVTYVL